MAEISNKMRKDAERAYNFYNIKLELEGLEQLEKSKKLIEHAETIKSEIVELWNQLKNDDFDQITSKYGLPLSKLDWLNLNRDAAKNKSKYSQKIIDKLHENTSQSYYGARVKASIIENNIINNKEYIEVPDPENNDIPEEQLLKNEELTNLWNECIEKRIKINTVLQPNYKQVLLAWMYLWDFSHDGEDFHLLVDKKKCEEDSKKPDKPEKEKNQTPKTYTIIDKFNRMIRGMKGTGEEESINKYLTQVGLDVKVINTPEID